MKGSVNEESQWDEMIERMVPAMEKLQEIRSANHPRSYRCQSDRKAQFLCPSRRRRKGTRRDGGQERGEKNAHYTTTHHR